MAFNLRIPGQASRSIRSFFGHILRPVKWLAAYVDELSPGDRAIATGLGLLVAATSIVSVLALERSFLVAVPAQGGGLTEGVVGSARFVNPLLALSDTERDLTMLTYAGLMGYDEAGNVVPVLAESFVRSEDEKTYTFLLRQDARFSDGNSVTADDIVFTVERAQDPALKSPVLSNWANIRVEAVDARTVRFTLPKPYAPFLEDATLGILPSHIWDGLSSEEFPFSPYNERPIGAGPFRVANVTRGKNGAIASYELAANADYALGRPYLDRIRVIVYPDYTALAAGVRSGQVESAYGVARAGALRVPYSRVFGVFFNPAAEPVYADAAVRKALSLAIDRTAIVRDVLGGYGTPTIGPVPAGTGVPDLPLPEPEEHLELARAALTGGGWAYSDEEQVWKKGGQTLSVTLKTSNVPELKALAAKIQEDWNALGVPVAVELYQPSELTQSVIRPRAYGALLFGEVIGSYPDLYAFWYSGERNDPGLNIAGYARQEVDALLERARTRASREEALSDLAQANALIAADYPAAFTHTPDFLYVVPRSLQGVNLTRVAEPSDRFRGVRYWHERIEYVWPFFTR